MRLTPLDLPLIINSMYFCFLVFVSMSLFCTDSNFPLFLNSMVFHFHSWIWHDYERILSQINPENHIFEDRNLIEARNGLPNSPFMELHYIKNNFFMEDNEILKNIKIISDIPSYIVQGRYDLICPPINAYNLSKNWKSSELVFVNTAGHSSSDEGIINTMLQGLNKLVNNI